MARKAFGLTWLGGVPLDVKLGGRMLLKYPSLTFAGGLALAVAIAIGAGWYDLMGKFLTPTLPLPEGHRIVWINTQNTLTNEPEARVVRDFLEWRGELRSIEDLGAYRSDIRNLMLPGGSPEPLHVAELTTAAFRTARVPPLLGRGLLESDEAPGAPRVVVIGYDVWQRAFGGRQEVIGSAVQLGNVPTTVIGVMPEGFRYPLNHRAWTPLPLRASYGALEGGAISVIGRLAPGVSRQQADAEVRLLGEQAAAALPATHEHLRPRVVRIGEPSGMPGIAQFAMTNGPVLLVLMIACLTVATLVYARTATREGEIAVRSALGASRARIVGQLFVETLVLASLAAMVGLVGADRALRWGIETANRSSGGAPFWVTAGLSLTTVLYAAGLAVVSAVMLSVLPALRATRAQLQSHLANRGSGGATLRFGRVWTGAMIVQVALTAVAIPASMENANHAMRKLNVRAQFPSREFLAARIDVERPFDEEATPAFQERRAQLFAELQRRVAEEPGVVAITFADRAPGAFPRDRDAQVESATGGGAAYRDSFATSAVGPGFFETFGVPMVAGRAFHGGDWSPAARTVIVNEAFARGFIRQLGSGSPIGARLRYSVTSARSSTSPADPSFEIVGVVRDIGLDPDDEGNELPFVFHPATAGAVSPLVMSARMRGNAATLGARLPILAANIDAGLLVQDAQPLDESVRRRDNGLIVTVGAQTAVTGLVLFLSALGIFSLVSVSVSRRTREIGLRAALGATRRRLLTGILSHAVVLMGSGIAAGGALLLCAVAAGLGPTGRPSEDVALFVGHLAFTSAVMIAACLLACVGPARRALRINPIEALREA